MKIAFLVPKFPSLSETFILNQITGLLDLGHEVEIFACEKDINQKVQSDIRKYNLLDKTHYLSMPQAKVGRILKAGSAIITSFSQDPIKIIKSLNFFQFGKQALSLRLLYFTLMFLDKEFDIIHCHFGYMGNWGVCLKEVGFKGKLVTGFYGDDIRLGIAKGGSYYRRLFEIGDCFLAIAEYSYKNLVRFGADPKKIISHPIGIDIEKFPYHRQSVRVRQPRVIIVLTVARLVEEKGLEYGIQAIGELIKKNGRLNLEYRLVGGGYLEDQLRKLSGQLGLTKVVRFLGPLEQKEVRREMQKAHLFLLPSIVEGLPIAPMEAQATGLPVVATDVGGVCQTLIDSQSGFLVPARDARALAEKLDYLIKNWQLWPKMGKCGRKFVENKYDIRKLNQRLVKIYRRLLSFKK